LATLGPVRDFIERADERGQDFVLTPRELEVWKLIAEGNTSKGDHRDARHQHQDRRLTPHAHA
jgi:hypothetical protein